MIVRLQILSLADVRKQFLEREQEVSCEATFLFSSVRFVSSYDENIDSSALIQPYIWSTVYPFHEMSIMKLKSHSICHSPQKKNHNNKYLGLRYSILIEFEINR